MNGKHYIGRKVSHIEKYDETAPISGVALLLDENNQILAGDQNGFVLDITCPYGTQAMANDILAKVRGHTYKGFRAENAPLAIDAELGDAVTVDGLYSVLAQRSVNFGPGHFSEIAAPGENELRHEYHYLTPTEKLQRKIAGTNSRITKTAEQIRLEVADEIEGLSGSITVEIGKITNRVAGAENNISTLTQTVNGLDFQVNNKEGKFSKLSIDVAGIHTTIEDPKNGLISQIKQKVGSIELSVKSNEDFTSSSIVLSVDGEEQTGTINLSGLVSFTDLSGKNKKTVINGDYITTGTISANRISGGTLTLGGSNNVSGKAEVKNASGKTLVTLDDKGITIDKSVKITATNVNCQEIEESGAGDGRTQVWEANMDGAHNKYTYKGYNMYDPVEVGNIGVEHWGTVSSLKGLAFELAPYGEFIAFGAQNSTYTEFSHKLAYWRNAHTFSNLDVRADSLCVSCTLDLQGNNIINGGFENGASDHVVVGDYKLVFNGGILTDIIDIS